MNFSKKLFKSLSQWPVCQIHFTDYIHVENSLSVNVPQVHKNKLKKMPEYLHNKFI